MKADEIDLLTKLYAKFLHIGDICNVCEYYSLDISFLVKLA